MAGLLSGSLRKVAGNLAGAAISRSGISSKIPAFADVEFGIGSKGRNKTENLAYPLSVESDPQQGHYIIFEIMQQDKAKLAGAKLVKSVKSQVEAITAESGQTKSENSIVGAIDTFGNLGSTAKSAYLAGAVSKGQRGASNSLQVSKKATTKMPVCIAVYMPPSVQVSYGAKYGETEIGVGAEAINAGIQAFMDSGGGMQGLAAGVGTAAGGIFNLGNLAKGAQNLMGKAPGMEGSEAVFAINRGSIITPRMELMFEGITRREFSFSFTFLPKSEQEAEIVEQIVKKFKYHMASNYGTGGLGGVDGVREMEIPDFFNIRYYHQNKVNPHLNLIKQCVLTKTDVEYGSDRYKAYADGRPQTTKLSLSFQELEIITKDYIEQGY